MSPREPKLYLTVGQTVFAKKTFPCTVSLTCNSVFISSQFKGCAYFPLSAQSGIPSEFSSREIAGYVNAF